MTIKILKSDDLERLEVLINEFSVTINKNIVDVDIKVLNVFNDYEYVAIIKMVE